MLLAFIVYLVATLGAIKAFVTSYVGYVLALFIVCYIVHKFKIIQFVENRKVAKQVDVSWDNLNEDTSYKLIKPLVGYPVGTVVYFNRFSNFAYVGTKPKPWDKYVSEDDVLSSIDSSEVAMVTEQNKTPLDININKLKWVAITMLSLHLLLPTEKTLQYAGAAYLIQSTYESEFVQEAGSLAGKAITNQLRKWATDNPDVNGLLESLEQTKNQAEKLVK
jgi:hypothetical protein